jgi:hypothetical protein
MAAENGMLQTLLSAATIFGVIGYGVVNFISGYREFKRDAYEKLSRKVEKDDCKDFRREGKP